MRITLNRPFDLFNTRTMPQAVAYLASEMKKEGSSIRLEPAHLDYEIAATRLCQGEYQEIRGWYGGNISQVNDDECILHIGELVFMVTFGTKELREQIKDLKAKKV